MLDAQKTQSSIVCKAHEAQKLIDNPSCSPLQFLSLLSASVMARPDAALLILCGEERDVAWLMIQEIAGDAYRLVEVRA